VTTYTITVETGYASIPVGTIEATSAVEALELFGDCPRCGLDQKDYDNMNEG